MSEVARCRNRSRRSGPTEPECEAIVDPRPSTPATPRSTLLRRPDHMVRSRLTWEEHGCGEELIEAPIVESWVAMLNQVHLDVSRRQRRRRHLTLQRPTEDRPDPDARSVARGARLFLLFTFSISETDVGGRSSRVIAHVPR